jgi:hypothetical protein
MTTSESMIGTTSVRIVRANGQVLEIELGVGIPTQQPTGEWRCPISCGTLTSRPFASGETSLQSVALAIRKLRALVSAEISSGATLYAFGEVAELDTVL